MMHMYIMYSIHLSTRAGCDKEGVVGVEGLGEK